MKRRVRNLTIGTIAGAALVTTAMADQEVIIYGQRYSGMLSPFWLPGGSGGTGGGTSDAEAEAQYRVLIAAGLTKLSDVRCSLIGDYSQTVSTQGLAERKLAAITLWRSTPSVSRPSMIINGWWKVTFADDGTEEYLIGASTMSDAGIELNPTRNYTPGNGVAKSIGCVKT